MPRKPNLFTPGASTEEAAADVIIEPIEAKDTDVAEPAPVADLRPVAVRPAQTDSGIHMSAAEWRDTAIPTINKNILAVNKRLGELSEQRGIVELSLALGHDGANALVVENREKERLAKEEHAGLLRALERAEAELARAEKQEVEAEREKRRDRARTLVQERIGVCARFDAALERLAALAAELSISTRRLSGFAADTGVSLNRLLLSGAYIGAAWHAGEELGKMLDLARDKPLPTMRSLAENEVRFWRRFVGDIEIPAVAPDAVAPDAVEAEAPELDDPLIGQHGGVVLGEPLSTGGKVYEPDAILPPELCMKWPLPNRRALAKQQRVRFLTEPQPAAAGEAELMS